MADAEKFGRGGWNTNNGGTAYVGHWTFDARVNPHLGSLSQLYRHALGVHDRQHRDEIRRVSDAAAGRTSWKARVGLEGPDEDLAVSAARFVKLLRKDILELRKAPEVIAGARTYTQDLRKALSPTIDIEPTDTAGAIRRSELRRAIAAMPMGERTKFIRKGDMQVVTAVLEVPAELSGVGSEFWDKLYDKALEERHGDILAECRDTDAAAETVERAVSVANALLMSEAIAKLKMTGQDFQEFAAGVP